MSDYHTTYKGPEGQTTQWEDIQIKLGNMAPKPKPEKAPTWEGEQEEVRDARWLHDQDEEALSGEEDNFADDRALDLLRQKRIQQLREASTRPVYTSLDAIRASDFAQQVTEASKHHWVVLLLHKDSHEGCAILADCLSKLAAKHPDTRFLKIISTECIAGFPDGNLPTVLLYHQGKCVKPFTGLTIWGGKRASPEQVALVLNQEGAVCQAPDGAEREDGGNIEPHEREVRQLVKRVVLQRQQELEDEDSDFSS